ncbi:MAG TPA: class I SAM-dependent methyltransferase [Candidatus Obscuribacterales bacterium]
MISLVDHKIEDYAIAKSEPTSALLQELVKKTHASTELPQMLTGPIEGRFLKMMALMVGAKRILEIGMFTGYSALSMAEALPADGELLTCEIDPKHIAIAKEFYARSEHGKKIKILEGPALKSIEALKGPFDLCFIDADKTNYPNYYEAVLPLMRTGGVILVDNVLWSGRVLNPSSEDDFAIVKLNDRIAKDDRVDRVLLPIRDGVFCVRKK